MSHFDTLLTYAHNVRGGDLHRLLPLSAIRREQRQSFRWSRVTPAAAAATRCLRHHDHLQIGHLLRSLSSFHRHSHPPAVASRGCSKQWDEQKQGHKNTAKHKCRSPRREDSECFECRHRWIVSCTTHKDTHVCPRGSEFCAKVSARVRAAKKRTKRLQQSQ